MRIGILLNELGADFGELRAQARDAADAGFATLWLAQRPGWDALTALTVLSREAPGLRLGTSVIPTYPRHPIALATQALTTQAATGVPLDLGVGVSHQHIVEGQHGLSFERPARHLREYLQALNPLLRKEDVDFHGETLTAVAKIDAPGAESPSVLVGALSPASLRVTGAHADGVISIWGGPRSLGEYIVPTVSKAAAEAGRSAPRIITGQLMCVTAEPDARRAEISELYAGAKNIPAYRAMFDRDSVDGIGDTVLAGGADYIADAVRQLEAAGATELLVMPIGTSEEQARTREVLGRL
jgi:F420-dependent oxidoreductase-like protein